MDNLTHSLSKKSYSGNGFGMTTTHHKSVYDDVFGGAPKFGVPTLAPRFEDYTEIFGGFHSSRGSSVPILDLPVVEEVELAFDVHSSRLDYSEVFGGFDGLDFALSYEDLSRKSNGRDDSSDDAWSPDQSECLSDETEPSACSERSENLLNTDANPLFDDVRQFNVLYHKVSQKPSEKVSNKGAHIAQVHAIPGHAYLMNDTHPSPVIEDKGPKMLASNDPKSNTELRGRRAEERCFKKSTSLPAKSVSRAPGCDLHLVGSSRSTFTGKRPFVTVNDINLRTRPSRLPPPSRPPPVFAVEKGEPQKTNSKLRTSKTFAFERMSGKSSPPFYDVEIDASSSKVAPVAQATEGGQAKIRRSKEEMEKNVALHSHSKLQAQETDKIVEEKIDKPFDGDNSCEDDKVQGVFVRCGKGMEPSIHEGQNVIQISEVASDLLDDEKYIDLVEKPMNRRHDEESSSQSSHKPEGVFAWRQETEYFEVVEADMSLEVDKQDKVDKSNVLQNKEGPAEHTQYINVAAEASQQQEVMKEVKASKEAPKLEERNIQLEMWEDACELSKNEGRLNKPKENPKNVKVDVTSYTSEATKKKIERPKQYPQIDADRNVDMQVELDVPEQVEVTDNSNGVCDMTDSYEVIINVHAKKAIERIPMYCIATKECDRNLEEAVEQVDDVKWEIHQGERKKHGGSSEREENRKNEKEICQGQNSGGIVKEVTEQEESEKKLQLNTGHDESENDFKRTYEQEDKEERHRKPDFEIEEKKETVVETRKIVENEWYGVSCATGEFAAGLTGFWKQELSKLGATVAFEDEDTEVSALKGSTGTSQCVIEHEELAEQTEDADQVKWDEDEEVANFDQDIHDPAEIETICSFNGMFKLNNKICEPLETAQATISQGEDKKLKTKFENYDQDISTPEIVNEEISISSGESQSDLQHRNDKIQKEDNTKLPFLEEFVKNSDGADNGIGNCASKQDKKISQMTSDPERTRANTHEKGQSGKVNNVVQMNFSEESAKEKSTIPQVFTQWTENGKKIGAGLFTVPDFKNTLNIHQRGTNEDIGPKQRQVNVALAPDDRKIEERLHQGKELEKEQLRKLEEEREREREREKDRMAVDRTTLEVRERLYAEARDRAERSIFGRSTTEARQRAAVEARGRLDKESMEARLRAERAAVERANAEARQRAFEKAMADKASSESREKVERSVADRFYGSSGNAEMRHSSSFWQDLPDLQSRSAGTSNMTRSVYSTTNGGVESESPQRSKARLERYRRTAERAAKALAEKNMRDLLAQREQAERSRLAENLDAEVRRWSSGKEGNLRALLSTLQYILGPDSGWQPVPLTEVITSAAVKKAYRKATLCVHPDKLQQRGASIQQKYVCEKVFDLLKEAWNTFNSEER